MIAYITWIDFSACGYLYVRMFVAVAQWHKFVTNTQNYSFLQYAIIILMHQPELENYFLASAPAHSPSFKMRVDLQLEILQNLIKLIIEKMVRV